MDNQEKNSNSEAMRPLTNEEYVEMLLQGKRPSEWRHHNEVSGDILAQIEDETEKVNVAEDAETVVVNDKNDDEVVLNEAEDNFDANETISDDEAEEVIDNEDKKPTNGNIEDTQAIPIIELPTQSLNTNEDSGIVEAENSDIEKESVNMWKEIREWIIAIGIAVILALVIRNFVFTLVKVQGSSMEPTLQSSDRLFVNRLMYKPEKNDIVIFTPHTDPKRPYIKRVIATEGDTVFIDFETGDVYVNDELLDEPYIKEKTRHTGSYIMSLIAKGEYSRENPIVIEKNKIFVMGDNRNNSKDSRELGQVPTEEILGGAVFRFWPINNFGSMSKGDTALLPCGDEYGL